MTNQAKKRYTDPAYVIHQQWLIGGVQVTFPIVHNYLQRRLAAQQQQQQPKPADADPKCRCLKSEPLLSERKQRRRKSRSLERQRSRRSANSLLMPNGDCLDSAAPLAHGDSTTDDDDAAPVGTSAVVAEVYHRVNSTFGADDETSSTKTLVNRHSDGHSEKDHQWLTGEDLNRNRVEVADRNAMVAAKRNSSPVVVLRKHFFEPISESLTSCDDGDDRSMATSTSDYATVNFGNQVRQRVNVIFIEIYYLCLIIIMSIIY